MQEIKEQLEYLANNFSNALGGDQWLHRDNWGVYGNTSTSHCVAICSKEKSIFQCKPLKNKKAWDGIYCDEHGLVAGISLYNNQVHGMLPEDLPLLFNQSLR